MLSRVIARVDRTIGIADAQSVGVLRMAGKAAGHVFRASGQASFEIAPGVARVIAAQDLGLGTAGLGGRVAAKLDRIVRAGAYRPVTGPGRGAVLRRAKKDSVWDCWMVGHGDRVGAPQAILALRPVFPAIVGTISADTGAGE